MSYQALARKYRPQSFSDVIGQETVVRTLQNAIEQNRIQHAYLFSGVRGVGKTTTAHILAKALNCVKGPTLEPCNVCSICREITDGIDLDVREIDAATYTGVDNIRELRDVTQFQPARDHYRTFIIDEAHMLSTGAWNALLKLIEEPPPHVIFMFATTEMHKVPATILSRVQKFSLRKVTVAELVTRLEEICVKEGIEADRAALEIIARRGEGSVRDALSLLDQVIAFSGRVITSIEVATVLGLSETSFFARIVRMIGEGDHASILDAVQEAAESGRDFKLLYRDLLSFVRNLLIVAGGASKSLLSGSPEDLVAVESVSGDFSYSELLRIANLLLKDDETVSRAEHQRLAVEIALLKAATFPRLRSIEEAIATGDVALPARPATVPARSEPPRRAAPSTSGYAAAAPRSAPRVENIPEPEPARPLATAGDDGSAFVARVLAVRPMVGTYLTSARAVRKDGATITITFAPAQSYFAEQLTEQIRSLEENAEALYGEPTRVVIETESPAGTQPGRRGEDKPSPLGEDPVVQSFSRHLGAELFEPRNR